MQRPIKKVFGLIILNDLVLRLLMLTRRQLALKKAMIITITVIAVRNLPGLLEMILLNRLPMDPGARYDYAAISRYTLTAVGIVIALNTVGIRWSSLQWLGPKGAAGTQ